MDQDLKEGVHIGRCCCVDHSVGECQSFDPNASSDQKGHRPKQVFMSFSVDQNPDAFAALVQNKS